MFNNMTTDGMEKQKDTLGGRRIFDSAIYNAKIKLAYGLVSEGGAKGVHFLFEMDGAEFRITQYVASRTGKNYYERDGKKYPLPGFTIVNDICMIAGGAELSEMELEDRVVKVYNPKTKQEEPTTVPVLVDLLDQEVALGVQRVLENKSVYNESTKKYEPTEEEIEINEIDKVFHPELKLTVAEAMNDQEATFWDAWIEQREGQVRDKRTAGRSGVRKGVPSRPSKSNDGEGGRKKKASVFNKK